ncbi:18606_t:CDS:2 [Funneliformis geosporum]|nr:18606_t:CDS:2 [Funneliformis geosporum]
MSTFIKEEGDENVPKDKARIYLVQFANGLIKIKYLIRPLPSIHILQTFTIIKIPVSFDDFEQFAKFMVDLMNFQQLIKVVTRPNHINTTSVQDTPEKKKNVKNRNKPSSPKSPYPCGSPSKLPSLI